MICGVALRGTSDELAAHAERCHDCARVLSVLQGCGATWRAAQQRDARTSSFRERRIARKTAPLRRRATSTIVAISFAIGATAALAAVRLRGPSQEPQVGAAPSLAIPGPAASPVRPASSPAPAMPTAGDSPAPVLAAATRQTGTSAAVPHPRAERPEGDAPDSPHGLWVRSMAELDRGDRAAAEAHLKAVLDHPGASPSLRHRAAFRWAEVLAARGDRTAPQAALWDVVRSGDPSLSFDAAVLLERCAPTEGPNIWDAYLRVHPTGTWSDRARARRDGSTDSGGAR